MTLTRECMKKKRFRDKYLYGYWQHLSYFEEYLDEITEMMTPAYEQSPVVRSLMEEFRTTPTCAVHVRGGDITGPGREYFAHALERMEREKPGLRYLVFTNDARRAKEALGDGMEFVSALGSFSDVDEFFPDVLLSEPDFIEQYLFHLGGVPKPQSP